MPCQGIHKNPRHIRRYSSLWRGLMDYFPLCYHPHCSLFPVDNLPFIQTTREFMLMVWFWLSISYDTNVQKILQGDITTGVTAKYVATTKGCQNAEQNQCLSVYVFDNDDPLGLPHFVFSQQSNQPHSPVVRLTCEGHQSQVNLKRQRHHYILNH